MFETFQKLRGNVGMVIEFENGEKEYRSWHNTVLNNGKNVMARTLAGEIGSSFSLYVCKMVFGNTGTIGDVPRFVDASREGLFGPAVISKNVIANIDPNNPTQVIFTAIMTYDDAVDANLNEMGLQLADGTFYSMATFGNITKTSLMQITWNWSLNFC
jgi:hypothetical protein